MTKGPLKIIKLQLNPRTLQKRPCMWAENFDLALLLQSFDLKPKSSSLGTLPLGKMISSLLRHLLNIKPSPICLPFGTLAGRNVSAFRLEQSTTARSRPATKLRRQFVARRDGGTRIMDRRSAPRFANSFVYIGYLLSYNVPYMCVMHL